MRPLAPTVQDAEQFSDRLEQSSREGNVQHLLANLDRLERLIEHLQNHAYQFARLQGRARERRGRIRANRPRVMGDRAEPPASSRANA